MLEDVICVAFLEHYLPGFMTRVDEEKLAGILAKTWKRMSEHGHKYALQLQLPQGVVELLECGLNALGAPDAALSVSKL
jgi:NAD-dependent oxidoreductase involved in siderophore biosynthesis